MCTLTLSTKQVSIGGRRHAKLLGCAEAAAVQKDRQVHDVAHIIMAVDVGITQHAVQVLVDGFDDDVGVAGKDGDERALGEEHSHLHQAEIKCVTTLNSALEVKNVWRFVQKTIINT